MSAEYSFRVTGLLTPAVLQVLDPLAAQRLPPNGLLNESCPRCGRESGASYRDEP